MPRKINPAKATPQAARSLRVGTRSKTRAAEDPPPESGDGDKDPGEDGDEDEKKDQEAHDAACATAAEACRAAADAYEAASGTDSASALQSAEEASVAARDACTAGEASCASMRGAEPMADADPSPPPAPGARAIAAAAGAPTVAAHLEVAQLARAGRELMEVTGAKSVDVALMTVEKWRIKAAKVDELQTKDRAANAASNIATRTKRLEAAVHAGMPRAQAFNIKADGSVGAPKAVWLKGTADDLDATLSELGYKAGAASPRTFIAPAGDDSEASLAERARASGMTLEARRAAEENVARSRAKEKTR